MNVFKINGDDALMSLMYKYWSVTNVYKELYIIIIINLIAWCHLISVSRTLSLKIHVSQSDNLTQGSEIMATSDITSMTYFRYTAV